VKQIVLKCGPFSLEFALSKFFFIGELLGEMISDLACWRPGGAFMPPVTLAPQHCIWGTVVGLRTCSFANRSRSNTTLKTRDLELVFIR
jgi:hypothetical protein